MTSLIYIAIIVLWIAVLVPMWIRRVDRVSESKSTEKFSSAMELLGTKVTAETAVTSGAAARDPKPPVTPRLAAERARKAAEMRAAAAARGDPGREEVVRGAGRRIHWSSTIGSHDSPSNRESRSRLRSSARSSAPG